MSGLHEQEDVDRHVQAQHVPNEALDPRRLYYHARGDAAEVISCARQYGVALGEPLRWLCFYDGGHKRHVIVALHRFSGAGDAELSMFGDRGLVSRLLLRNVASWAFDAFALHRVTARILSVDHVSQDYARRAGFRFEGTARSYFAPGVDASVWSLRREDCRWLKPLPALTNALSVAEASSILDAYSHAPEGSAH